MCIHIDKADTGPGEFKVTFLFKSPLLSPDVSSAAPAAAWMRFNHDAK